MSARTRRATRALLQCAAPLLLAACTDFFHDAAPPEPVLLSLVTSHEGSGPLLNPALAPAFDQTNRVRVRVESESTGALLLDQELAANPDDEGIRLSLPIDLGDEDRLRVRVSVVLLRTADVLFEGSLVTELRRGRPASAEVPLVPRATELSIEGPERFTVLQDTARLVGSVLMATGHAIPDAQITWVSLDQGILSVNATGLVTSLSEGEGRIVGLSQGLADTVGIEVAAEVVSVVVAPASADLAPGQTRSFSAQARDARGNTLSRTFAWTSAPTTVATVASTGTVTAVAPGTAQIQATTAGVTGTATVEVSALGPVVSTGGVASVTAASGQLLGTVNPSGFRADAWFEFGESAALSGFERTAEVSVGAGLEPVSFVQFIRDLPPATRVYYRIAARNVGGEARGEIRSFVTAALRPPTAPTGFSWDPAFAGDESFAGFDLSWTVTSENEDFFELDRRDSFDEGGDFLPLAQPGPRQARYLDTTALPSMGEDFNAYDYRIRACNTAGCSTYAFLEFVYYSDFAGDYFRGDMAPSIFGSAPGGVR